MSFKECRRIELQAFDLFDRIERIHRQHPAVPENIRDKYILLFKVLEETAYELTAEATLAFANLFSRLDYIGKAKKMTPSDRYAIQTMRRNCNKAMGNRFQPDMQEYLYDLRALARFVSVGFGEDIPASLLAEIPRSNRPYTNASLAHIPYVRAYVTSWNDSLIFASSDSENEPFIIVNYVNIVDFVHVFSLYSHFPETLWHTPVLFYDNHFCTHESTGCIFVVFQKIDDISGLFNIFNMRKNFFLLVFVHFADDVNGIVRIHVVNKTFGDSF